MIRIKVYKMVFSHFISHMILQQYPKILYEEVRIFHHMHDAQIKEQYIAMHDILHILARKGFKLTIKKQILGPRCCRKEEEKCEFKVLFQSKFQLQLIITFHVSFNLCLFLLRSLRIFFCYFFPQYFLFLRLIFNFYFGHRCQRHRINHQTMSYNRPPVHHQSQVLIVNGVFIFFIFIQAVVPDFSIKSS